MHEEWLQKYIQDHYQKIGLSQIHGPYKRGADFKGFYAGKPVKIEAEWDYADYINHKHPPGFADVLVVATLEPVPECLRENLPISVIQVSREDVIEWAQPRRSQKNREDYHGYPWRRFSKSLFDLYAYSQKQISPPVDFIGSAVTLTKRNSQTPAGFQFGPGGKEEGFKGPPEEKAYWDQWLVIAHSVSNQFKLKPALLRPTWIDRIAFYYHGTGRITDSDLKRFQEVVLFIDEILSRREP